MKLFLKLLFGLIFLWMTVLTVRTGMAVSLWEAWPSYAANPWAIATLYDAYFGFVTFYVWVAYKERKTWSRILWFLLIMGLGNIATPAFTDSKEGKLFGLLALRYKSVEGLPCCLRDSDSFFIGNTFKAIEQLLVSKYCCPFHNHFLQM